MKKCVDNRVYYKSDLLSEVSRINHCFTTRCGGVSQGKITGLNLGFRCGDRKDDVVTNYKLISADMGFDYESITAGRQTHSSNIRIITKKDVGKGVSRESDIDEVDGLVTTLKKVPLVVYFADCVPILLVEETAGVIAAVHSGWRGTVSGIVGNAVDIMTAQFGAKPEQIKAAIGPSIGKCCFETGEDVGCQFEDRFIRKGENNKFFVNLQSKNREILLSRGLREQNIDDLNLCTICNCETMYSYRKHKENTGRMGAFIELL